MKALGTEFKVGLFAIVALSTLGYMFFVLSPDTFETKEYNTYYTILRNAAGIIPKTHVKTNGVTVGKVRDIALKANTTRVTLEVREDVEIPEGSRLEIRSVGLLGDVHLEIIRAPDSGEFIKNGGMIPQTDGATDMQAMLAMAGDIAQDVKKVTNSLAAVLGGEEGEASIARIIANLEQTSADVRATTTTMRRVLGEREEDLGDIIADVRDGVSEIKQFGASLNAVMDQDNKQKIERILASFDQTMTDVQGSARNFSLIAEKVERGEGTIGRLLNEESTISELEGAIKDIRDVLQPATKLNIAVDYHSEFSTEATSQHYVNGVFKTRPDRYYILGLTDTAYDQVETTTTTIVENSPVDVDSVETKRERIQSERRFKFNLQFAKRWYDLALRFGLFESSGGFAADYFVLQDRLKFSIEAFDWDLANKTTRRNVHLKSYVSLLFYNHIYAMAGIDDPTRTDPATGRVDEDLAYFFGAGLTFTDQDLKTLLGTAALAL